MKTQSSRFNWRQFDFKQWLVVGLKLLLTVGIVFLIHQQLAILAALLFVLSKWQGLFDRYYLKSVLIDLAIGLSLIGLMSFYYDNWLILIWLTAIFLFSALVIKPLPPATGKIVQGLISQTLVSLVLIYQQRLVGFLPEPALLIAIWLNSYWSSKYSLTDFPRLNFKVYYPLIWGLFSAQMFWILNHWQAWVGILPQFVVIQLIISLAVAIFCYLEVRQKTSRQICRHLVFASLTLTLAGLFLVGH